MSLIFSINLSDSLYLLNNIPCRYATFQQIRFFLLLLIHLYSVTTGITCSNLFMFFFLSFNCLFSTTSFSINYVISSCFAFSLIFLQVEKIFWAGIFWLGVPGQSTLYYCFSIILILKQITKF